MTVSVTSAEARKRDMKKATVRGFVDMLMAFENTMLPTSLPTLTLKRRYGKCEKQKRDDF